MYNMRIFLISYGIIDYDGRLRELLNVCERIGEVNVACCTIDEDKKYFGIEHRKHMSLSTYIHFLFYVLRAYRASKPYDIIVADNFFSALPVMLIKNRKNKIIQDVRELYFINSVHGKSKILISLELCLMRKADVVLCANNERADIMKEKLMLRRRPIVFENIRFLSGTYNDDDMEKKYANFFGYRFNLLSTSGLFMARDTDKLIMSMTHLTKDFGLFFVGDYSKADYDEVERICRENNLTNVHVLGKVPANELLYIVRKCDIGLVHYHKNDLNNKYCASGKIFEFLHEGIPIVTTENPPLKSFCKQNRVGVADDTFYNGIIEVANNYEHYTQNVKNYIKNISVDDYNRSISVQIMKALGLDSDEK